MDAQHETWLLLFCGFHAYFDSLFPSHKSPIWASFVQRPVRRPKTASSVPLRSWWRRSCRLPACGRARTRARGSSWAASRRAAAEPAEATAPYPESARGTNGAPKTDRDDSTDQNQVKRGWRWRGWERSSDVRKDFCCLHTPFFFNHHLSSEENTNNSIVCLEVHRFNPTSLCVWLCVIQQRGHFESIVAASLICRASG